MHLTKALELNGNIRDSLPDLSGSMQLENKGRLHDLHANNVTYMYYLPFFRIDFLNQIPSAYPPTTSIGCLAGSAVSANTMYMSDGIAPLGTNSPFL